MFTKKKKRLLGKKKGENAVFMNSLETFRMYVWGEGGNVIYILIFILFKLALLPVYKGLILFVV